MKLLDGRLLRDKILVEISSEVARMSVIPKLVVVQVGDDPASDVYIRNKFRACKKTGIESEHIHLPNDVEQATLNARMASLSEDEGIHGVLLQLPLPEHLDDAQAMKLLNPEKDVDGFHPINLGRLLAGQPGPVPCTPAGLRALLEEAGIETRGKELVVLGRSLIVGKPAALLFLEKSAFGDATVTVCHSRSQNLNEICLRADILIAAIGRAQFVKADMVKEGAVVVDVGINRIEDPTSPKGSRIVGDCDFEGLSSKVSAMTPVPGGVGVMTVAMLMKNTLEACRRQIAMKAGA
ncbi:bifunctional methylenetetrahydrofolate dehydrogenase/methenyltetrahydrofolate cyclohydrolase FolD [bacterium]|nr:bifunctional methylenetetrahydrofolate dehydrogenase/methenyltetrahydrofolate cyclohydrolase FolD [bacterium]